MRVFINDRSEYGREHNRRLVCSPIAGGKLLEVCVVEASRPESDSVDDTKMWLEVTADDMAALGRAFSKLVREP